MIRTSLSIDTEVYKQINITAPIKGYSRSAFMRYLLTLGWERFKEENGICASMTELNNLKQK